MDIDNALKRIEADPRHRDLTVVMRREVPGRLFPGWSMVAARVTPVMAPEIDRAIDHCVENPAKAIDAVLALVLRRHG